MSGVLRPETYQYLSPNGWHNSQNRKFIFTRWRCQQHPALIELAGQASAENVINTANATNLTLFLLLYYHSRDSA